MGFRTSPSVRRYDQDRLDTRNSTSCQYNIPLSQYILGDGGGSRCSDADDVGAVLPGLIDKVGPFLHQLPPERQRIPARVVTCNTRYDMTKRRLGDFALYTVIAGKS